MYPPGIAIQHDVSPRPAETQNVLAPEPKELKQPKQADEVPRATPDASSLQEQSHCSITEEQALQVRDARRNVTRKAIGSIGRPPVSPEPSISAQNGNIHMMAYGISRRPPDPYFTYLAKPNMNGTLCIIPESLKNPHLRDLVHLFGKDQVPTNHLEPLREIIEQAAESSLEHAKYLLARLIYFMKLNTLEYRSWQSATALHHALKCLRLANWNFEMARTVFLHCAPSVVDVKYAQLEFVRLMRMKPQAVHVEYIQSVRAAEGEVLDKSVLVQELELRKQMVMASMNATTQALGRRRLEVEEDASDAQLSKEHIHTECADYMTN